LEEPPKLQFVRRNFVLVNVCRNGKYRAQGLVRKTPRGTPYSKTLRPLRLRTGIVSGLWTAKHAMALGSSSQPCPAHGIVPYRARKSGINSRYSYAAPFPACLEGTQYRAHKHRHCGQTKAWCSRVCPWSEA